MANKSKIIVITGTTRGLGRAMTERFIELGHTVIGCGRKKRSVTSMQNEFDAPNCFDVVDVTADNEVKSWAKKIIRSAGVPDILINNAGAINEGAPLWEISDKEFAKVIEANINGVATTIRHFVPAMIKKRRGIIVNFSSGWGRMPAPEYTPYCTSKWAIEGLSKSLAEELPKGLASVALSPGIIDTDMLRICWGPEAGSCETPEEWSHRAAKYILKITPKQNGKSLSVPN